MKVAVEGCCHGELDKIYEQIASLERKNAYKVDLLLICGDFQAIRNHEDLLCMAVPPKYRQLGGFHKYYLGQKKAPILTIVIGGNHEASNYLWELYHGGWLAPNIYFLGFSGCVQVNGIRIAGSSGIFKPGDYARGHYETLPYDNSSLRSIYHVRQYDVFKLARLSSPTIFLSHDWPNTIEKHGNTEALLRRKPFFRKESETGSLGSPPMLDLLKTLKPSWWFSAHLHVKFEALYRHDGSQPRPRPPQNPDEILIDDLEDEAPAITPVPNPDEINIDDDFELEGEPTTHVDPEPPHKAFPEPQPNVSSASENTETRFLALDKCLPKRECIEVVDISIPESAPQGDIPRLTFDPEWLAITRALHPYLCTSRTQVPLPKVEDARVQVAKELEWVRENVPNGGLHEISEVQKFWRTAPGPSKSGKPSNRQPSWYTNPQTEALTQLLQIVNKVNPVPAGVTPRMTQGSASPHDAEADRSDEAAEQEPQTKSSGTELNLDESVDAREPATADETSGGGEPVTDPEPVASGGWSPSRMVE